LSNDLILKILKYRYFRFFFFKFGIFHNYLLPKLYLFQG
jgi:hypothetical protein